jgi:hypothetical protein
VKNFVDLVGAVAWPAVILAAVIVLRNPLSNMLQELSKRATKVSASQFAVELPRFRKTCAALEGRRGR